MEDEAYFKDLKERGKAKDKPKAKKKTPKRDVKPYGYYAFMHLSAVDAYFYFSLFLVIAVVGAITLDLSMHFSEENERVYRLSLFGAVLIIGVIWTVVLIAYGRFRGWKEKLPFEITGIERFLAYQRMPESRYTYRYVSVTVTPKNTADKKQQAIIDDALKIIVNHFEPLKQKGGAGVWSVTDKLSIKGPADDARLRWIIKSIKKDFVEIQKRLNCIEKIHFTAHSTTFRLKVNRQDRIIIPD